MIVHSAPNEFELLARGAELRLLPDIPLVALPVMDTTLHRFAGVTVPSDFHINGGPPHWVFRVRHTGSWKTPIRRPKIMLYQSAESRRHISISFKVPSRALFKSADDVFAELERNNFGIKSLAFPVTGTSKPSESDDDDQELVKLREKNALALLDLRSAGLHSAIPYKNHNQWASTQAAMDALKRRLDLADVR